MSDTNALLNKLIQCDSDVGVIKYIGPIQELKDNDETWYGIEWRDPNRGKHDGSFKGTRYFQTKFPKSGSFVRPNKVSFGVDIKQAVTEKYLEVEEINNGEEEVLYNNFNVADKRITINCVNLSYYKIGTLDSSDILTETFPYMKELDLEGNLLTSWNQIFAILHQLKGLRLINISNNSLTLPETSKFAFDEIMFDNIQHLIMNRMNYTWSNVETVLRHFPNLIELKVCFNLIGTIDKTIDSSLLRNLRILDLESNKLNDWNDLKKFGCLQKLETLYANDLGISVISFPETEFSTKTDLFPNLKLLSINDNIINDWQSINELIKLSNLEELTLKFNPLNASDSVENVRQLIVAKLQALKMFNRTKILPDERKGSDIDYIKKFANEWLELENKDGTMSELELEEKRKKFHNDHPSYTKLVEKYGAAERSEANVKEENLKSNLICVNVLDEKSGNTKRKKVPLTTEVSKLKQILMRLYKYKADDFDNHKLCYTTALHPDVVFEIDREMRTLDFFAIDNEDTIIIRKKTPYENRRSAR